ncbi:PREDICTED: uncharacterized protein LOC103340593 isoform X2 [Prunus mume]|uniref:Uncharacterized protein LOC103340593 isoform X2 n=1 Tax=Prunus mume TaxID=102107 RepID=A0ABM1LWC2_PRUMU|nr:PREDICTED: uncharacterized protein LOC103340593 isoform X2 [Prunus mume]
MDQHKTDDNLRYVGGLTRVLAADASISFADADDDDFSIAKGVADSSSSLRPPLKKFFFEERDTPNSSTPFTAARRSFSVSSSVTSLIRDRHICFGCFGHTSTRISLRKSLRFVLTRKMKWTILWLDQIFCLRRKRNVDES